MRQVLPFFTALLFFYWPCFSQSAIKVYSRGSLIYQVDEADDKLYIATYGKGVVVYDMASGNFETMDISNSPLKTDDISSVQALSGDTQVVTTNSGSWLVGAGVWGGFTSNYTLAKANDGRVFSVGLSSLFELINGSQVPITDSATLPYIFNSVQSDYHNALYFQVQLRDSVHIHYSLLKYSLGIWSQIPDVFDTLNGVLRYFFDINDKMYCQGIYGDNIFTRVYQLNSTGWNQVPLPLTETQTYRLSAVAPDSIGAQLFFYSVHIITRTPNPYGGWFISDSVNSFVWNAVTQNVQVLPHANFPFGLNDPIGQVFIHANTYYIPSYFNGLVSWERQSNTFATVNYANTCIEDYGIGDNSNESNILVERNDSIYVVGNNSNFHIIDTTLANCSEQIATSPPYPGNPGFYKDKNGDIWVTDNHGNSVRNLTTGATLSCGTDSIYNIFFVYDSLVWMINNNDSVIVHNNQGFSTANFWGDYTCMDKYGNLWNSSVWNFPSISVQRLDKNGNVQVIKSWVANQQGASALFAVADAQQK